MENDDKMKTLKISFLFIFILSFALISCANDPPEVTTCTEHSDTDQNGRCDVCGSSILPEEKPDIPCSEHTDEDSDGSCDRCGATVTVEEPKEIKLIENSKANFVFVIQKTVDTDLAKKLRSIDSTLTSLGYEIPQLDDKPSTASEMIEVLIGNVETRGEQYLFNARELGAEGYFVKIVDNKIMILGGSDASLITAIDHFMTNGLGIKESTKKLKNATFTEESEIEIIQTEYNITGVTVGGVDIKNYVFAVDMRYSENRKLAESAQEMLYLKSGKWLPIVDINDITDESCIAIKTQEKSGGYGFEIKVSGNNLEIISEFPNKVLDQGEIYFTTLLYGTSGVVALNEKTVNVRDVNYEMFGAAGDGKTDDTEAMRKCHEYANKYGHNVSLNRGKSYYVGPMYEHIVIRTNVDFKDAHFIIDDRELTIDDPRHEVNLFKVESDYEWFSLKTKYPELLEKYAGGLPITTTSLDLNLGYKALIRITDSNRKTFIRYGANENSGSAQHDMIYIDEYGNFDKDTPLLFDYENVTAITIYRADDPAITINGGYFQHRANQCPSTYSYFGRSFDIRRSNLTVQNITYDITDERTGKYEGEPYNSFLRPENCVNVLFKDCYLDAHRTYWSVGSGGKEVGMGSKSISVANAHNIVLDHCIQTNLFDEKGNVDSDLWAIMSSNYCKNIYFYDCELSRFDAHAGIYNATIKGGKLGMIRIVGDGLLTVEDVDFHALNSANTIISMREDFGSFWKGKIIIKDVCSYTQGSGDVTLIAGHWYNHNFGYTIALPSEIIIDNFRIDSKTKSANVFGNTFSSELTNGMSDTVNGEPNVNPPSPPGKIIIRNNLDDTNFILPDKNRYPFFKDTEYIIED